MDLDFGKESCDEVMHFLYSKYGESKVASIGKFGTNKTKGTIRDMCKVLDYSLQEEDLIAKSFGEYDIEDIDLMISGELPVEEKAKEAIEYVNSNQELFEYVRKLNNLPKSFGLHSCGKICSTRELDDFLPSCYDKDGIRFLQGDMHDVEDMGLVKIDVLGLRTVDQEYDTLEMTNEDISYIGSKQDYNDPKVLDIFRNGDTVGIFQMASFGMRNTLKKMNVQGINDLSVANALYRPGAMAYIDNFCKRRRGEESFEYLHPDLEPILKSTYGIIVFQEQLIEIGRMAKIKNPDLLRKATGKKDVKLLAQVKPELEEKLNARGWTQPQFDKLWADMIEFSKYSFNKAHSSAYSMIAFITAKQKAYYPKEFYAGLMNSFIGKSDFVKENAPEIFADMLAHNIQIAPFNFRNDHRKCNVQGNMVAIGIPLIKDCNILCGEILYSLKDKQYDYFYELLIDMSNMHINSRQITTLINLGFFDEFGGKTVLFRIVKWCEKFKFGQSKSIKKDKIFDLKEESIIQTYSTDRNKDGEKLKSYTIHSCKSILRDGEIEVKGSNLLEIPLLTQMENQKESLGYFCPTRKQEDRPKLKIEAMYTANRKSDNKQFGYNITCTSIGSGIQSRFTIFNTDYNKCGEVRNGDIIYCEKYERDGRYFTLKKYHQVI